MALLNWNNITQPKQRGGLGLRDLRHLNHALMLKHLWKFVSGSQVLWAQILRAKYTLRSSIWQTGRLTNCTRLWKGMSQQRAHLKPHIRWIVGNGQQCQVFDAPWFLGWDNASPQNQQH